MEPNRSGTTDLWEAMTTMRAIRWFKPDRVPREVLWRLLDMAVCAPSGTNTQPWRFLVLESAADRGRLAGRLRELTGPERQAQIAANIEAAADPSRRRMYRGVQQLTQHLDDAPVFLVACLVRAESTAPEEVLQPGPVFQAIQNFQLAARSLGLGTVVTSFQSAMLAELRGWFAIPEGVHPVALVLLGYPDANFGPLNRKPAEAVTYWGGWDRVETRSP